MLQSVRSNSRIEMACMQYSMSCQDKLFEAQTHGVCSQGATMGPEYFQTSKAKEEDIEYGAPSMADTPHSLQRSAIKEKVHTVSFAQQSCCFFWIV